MTNTVNLDWNNLGFDYIKTDLLQRWPVGRRGFD